MLHIRCADTDNIIGAKEDIAMRLDGVVDIKHIEPGDDNILSKTFYTDYVRHMARFYFRSNLGLRQNFKSDVDAANWKSCHNAAKDFDKNILICVYEPRNEIEENVKATAVFFNVSEKTLWGTVRRFEEMVARKRGLI